MALALVIGTALLALGVLLGESDEIHDKGSVVCLECIGIG